MDPLPNHQSGGTSAPQPQRFSVKAGGPEWHFEVLLHTKIVNNTVPSFELVAYRPHKN
jgi:hypothetical protein